MTTRRVAEVRHPTGQERVELGDHPVEADASIAPSDLADAVLGPFQALWGDAQPTASQETVAKELAILDECHRAFLPIDTKVKDFLQEPGDRPQHPLPPCLRLDVDITIIGIATEAVAATFQFLVQVVQEQVGQER